MEVPKRGERRMNFEDNGLLFIVLILLLFVLLIFLIFYIDAGCPSDIGNDGKNICTLLEARK